jgi:hypothetical protein
MVREYVYVERGVDHTGQRMGGEGCKIVDQGIQRMKARFADAPGGMKHVACRDCRDEYELGLQL